MCTMSKSTTRVKVEHIGEKRILRMKICEGCRIKRGERANHRCDEYLCQSGNKMGNIRITDIRGRQESSASE